MRNFLGNRDENIFELANSILDKIKQNLKKEIFNQEISSPIDNPQLIINSNQFTYLKEQIDEKIKNHEDLRLNKPRYSLYQLQNKRLKEMTSSGKIKNKLKIKSNIEMESSTTLKKKRHLNKNNEDDSSFPLENNKKPKQNQDFKEEAISNSGKSKNELDLKFYKNYVILNNTSSVNLPNLDIIQNQQCQINSESSDLVCLNIKKKRKIYPVNQQIMTNFLLEFYLDGRNNEESKDLNHDDLINSKKLEVSCIKYDGKSENVKNLEDIINSFQEKSHYCFKSKDCPKQLLRKKVCSHMFKLFSKMAAKVMDIDEIKKLSLDLELKARLKDPLMGNEYKSIVNEYFERMKSIFDEKRKN